MNDVIVKTKKREQTAQRIIQAIKESGGLLTVAAKKSGFSYVTVWRYAQEFPSVKQALEEAKESVLDFAESKLYENIRAGDNTAIIFYLKTQGKHRGYTERQELTGIDGLPLNQNIKVGVNIVNVDAKTVAAAILEAERLGLTPEMLGGNGHLSSADRLPAQSDI